ncbi:MAG: adenylate/guanylate cyclase domain-containing protein, partial [Acidimicrobiia bacterium]
MGEAQQRQARRLAAIAVLDVVGYSRMMSEDEEGTLAALQAHRNELDPVLRNHGGRIVKGTGDGMLVEVPSAVEAVKAAIEAQRLMAERNAAVPAGRQMQFRIGINLGDVIVDHDEDVFGHGVNVAARLEALAPPGGICVSASIHDQVRGRVDCTFVDMGTVSVKNLPEPVGAYRVDPAQQITTAPESPSPYSVPGVAVFSFENLTGDPDQSYFTEGITEDLITALSHHNDLRVSSRRAVLSVTERELHPRDAARELDVAYVVNGSVRRAGNRVRIAAQLVEAETGSQLWGERFDRDLDDIFQVQDEITVEVAAHIHPNVERGELRRVRTASTDELEGWELMLRARQKDFTGTEEGSREAIRLLEIARDRDPANAEVRAQLAGAWVSVAFNRWRIDDRHPFEELYREAAEAYRLDSDNQLAVTIYTMAEAYRGNHEASDALSRRALALGPHHPLALTAAGQVKTWRGDPAAAIPLLSDAWRVARYEPWRYHIATNLAFSHHLNDGYEPAWAWAQRGLEASDYLQQRLIGAAALAQLERVGEA